jgi:hypothetical protein
MSLTIPIPNEIITIVLSYIYDKTHMLNLEFNSKTKNFYYKINFNCEHLWKIGANIKIKGIYPLIYYIENPHEFNNDPNYITKKNSIINLVKFCSAEYKIQLMEENKLISNHLKQEVHYL